MHRDQSLTCSFSLRSHKQNNIWLTGRHASTLLLHCLHVSDDCCRGIDICWDFRTERYSRWMSLKQPPTLHPAPHHGCKNSPQEPNLDNGFPITNTAIFVRPQTYGDRARNYILVLIWSTLRESTSVSFAPKSQTVCCEAESNPTEMIVRFLLFLC